MPQSHAFCQPSHEGYLRLRGAVVTLLGTKLPTSASTPAILLPPLTTANLMEERTGANRNKTAGGAKRLVTAKCVGHSVFNRIDKEVNDSYFAKRLDRPAQPRSPRPERRLTIRTSPKCHS